MNRRAFLAAIAGATLDPERLLYRPGAKLISIPNPAPFCVARIISVDGIDLDTWMAQIQSAVFQAGCYEVSILGDLSFNALYEPPMKPGTFGRYEDQSARLERCKDFFTTSSATPSRT